MSFDELPSPCSESSDVPLCLCVNHFIGRSGNPGGAGASGESAEPSHSGT